MIIVVVVIIIRYCYSYRHECIADSKNLEYGPGTIHAGFPSSLAVGVGGQLYYKLYSNFLASTVAGP